MSKNYTFEPAGNFIAAELIEEKEKTTPGGLYLPDQAKDRPAYARVISVGPGMRDMATGEMIPVPYEPGDILAINTYGSRTIELPSGKKIAIFAWGDVFGKITEVPTDGE